MINVTTITFAEGGGGAHPGDCRSGEAVAAAARRLPQRFIGWALPWEATAPPKINVGSLPFEGQRTHIHAM